MAAAIAWGGAGDSALGVPPDADVVLRVTMQGWKAWDDVSGTDLDPRLTSKARAEDMEKFRNHQVYGKEGKGGGVLSSCR